LDHSAFAEFRAQMARSIQLPSEKDQDLQSFRNHNQPLADQNQEQPSEFFS